MTDELLSVPETPVPPLEAARREYERLQRLHDETLAKAEEAGSDGELWQTDEWRRLRDRLSAARYEVSILEYRQVHK